MIGDGSDLVPADSLAETRVILERMRPLMELKGRGPLPELVETFYTAGGCWNLAIALHDLTGLPIEVYYLHGRPHHAYVVDGETAIDARGANPLRLVRLGADRTQSVVTVELLESLEDILGPDGLALIRGPAWVDASERTAALLVSLCSRGAEGAG